ncbi:hypothetical protein VNO78_05594 [Psophocarpus tetragonolobus]|uniref:Uncharacterized protein n=1 Tax=Psophocarpus tetragonolobus TaxID=3891 RepID=A0AAN9STW8_PSOTE
MCHRSYTISSNSVGLYPLSATRIQFQVLLTTRLRLVELVCHHYCVPSLAMPTQSCYWLELLPMDRMENRAKSHQSVFLPIRARMGLVKSMTGPISHLFGEINDWSNKPSVNVVMIVYAPRVMNLVMDGFMDS